MFNKDELKILNKGLEVLAGQVSRAKTKEANDEDMVRVLNGRLDAINAVSAKLNTKELFNEATQQKPGK